MKIVKIIAKSWHYLWHEDTPTAWVVQMCIAFLLIKYLAYPGLGFMFHTSYPIVAVVSGSMEHKIISHDRGIRPNICGMTFSDRNQFISFVEYWQLCGAWYDSRNISISAFSKAYFENGFNMGDIIFIYRQEPKYLKIGDTIVFKVNGRPDPIIHRIVEIKTLNGRFYFTTKGDHNGGPGEAIDVNISEASVLGKGVFRIPYIGYAKIWLYQLLSVVIR